MAKFSHFSHGEADTAGHHLPGNIARDGAPKRVTATAVHPGMTRRVQGQTIVAGGHEAAALDALSGQTIVPGNIKSTPGFGNAGTTGGNPLATPPGSKNLKAAAVSPGMRSRTSPHSSELGAAILRAALKN